MGKGSQRLSGSAASGDGGELLQEGFLAECVEGQVPPDVGTNGSDLGRVGRWKGRAEGTVHYRQQSALGQDEVFTVLAGEGPCRRAVRARLPTLGSLMGNLAASARRLVHGKRCELCEGQTQQGGKNVLLALVLEARGFSLFLLHSEHQAGSRGRAAGPPPGRACR